MLGEKPGGRFLFLLKPCAGYGNLISVSEKEETFRSYNPEISTDSEQENL